MMENVKIATQILGQGMLGIFSAIILVVIAVVIMQKIGKVFAKKEDKNENA